jgi:hypothetical protein
MLHFYGSRIFWKSHSLNYDWPENYALLWSSSQKNRSFRSLKLRKAVGNKKLRIQNFIVDGKAIEEYAESALSFGKGTFLRYKISPNLFGNLFQCFIRLL